jgi:hypothetical protein
LWQRHPYELVHPQAPRPSPRPPANLSVILSLVLLIILSLIPAGLALQSGLPRAAVGLVRSVFGITIVAQRPRHLLHLLIETTHRLVVAELGQRWDIEEFEERSEIHLRRIFPGAVEIDPHGTAEGFAEPRPILSTEAKNHELPHRLCPRLR